MRGHHFYKGKALDQELRSIYEDKGKLPDMSRLEHEYHRRTTRILLLLVGFFAILTAASWTGFFLFSPTQGEGGEIEMSIDGPEAVVAGVPQEITIRYKNRDRNPLAFGALRVRLPDALVIQEVSPAPTSQGQLEWNFGTLPSKASGEIRIKLIPYGVVDDKPELQATFSYKPANFNAEFQTFATHIFNIRAPSIAINFDGPTEATPGQEASFTARLKNESDQIFEKVQVTLTPPETFSVAQSDPQSENHIWKIDTLPPNAEQTVTFKGSFLSAASGTQGLKLQAGIIGKDNETVYILGEQTHNIEVKGTDIQVELFINGSPDQQWVRLGDTLTLNARLLNKTEKSIEGVQLKIPLQSTLIDWTQTTAERGSAKDGFLIFPNEDTLNLEPGKTQEYSGTIVIAQNGNQTASPFIELYAEIIRGTAKLRTPPLKLTVVSDLALRVDARYFGADGQPLGSGPLPPKVGEETQFMIRLNLKNTFHDLSNIIVTTILPEGIRFVETSQLQSGKITFNETSREVRFEISRMPVTTQEINAQFKVAATPKESDRGQLILLLGVSRVEALDTIAQVTFSTDAPSVSSSLESDPSGRGKGVVQ